MAKYQDSPSISWLWASRPCAAPVTAPEHRQGESFLKQNWGKMRATPSEAHFSCLNWENSAIKIFPVWPPWEVLQRGVCQVGEPVKSPVRGMAELLEFELINSGCSLHPLLWLERRLLANWHFEMPCHGMCPKRSGVLSYRYKWMKRRVRNDAIAPSTDGSASCWLPPLPPASRIAESCSGECARLVSLWKAQLGAWPNSWSLS